MAHVDNSTEDKALLALALQPHSHFSRSICEKFPIQFQRWIRNPANARWMLRNHPTSALSNNQKAELIAVSKLDMPK